jgi:hypothetical protein
MNRKKILYIAALAVGLLSTSCNDQFLEDKKLFKMRLKQDGLLIKHTMIIIMAINLQD